MKKRMLLLCATLLLALIGCTAPAEPTQSPEPAYDITANPPLNERCRTAAVPDFLNEEQQLLYRRTLRVYSQLFGNSTEDFDHWAEDDPYYQYDIGALEVDEQSYTQSLGRYAKWEAFDALVHSVFTDRFWTEKNQGSFLNVDGTVYFVYASRGGGCYNERFPDTFTLVSQSEDEIVFTLTGHYSYRWPMEGESYEDRDRRLESGWDWTCDFTLRMVRTEDGWRFDRFYDPLPDEELAERSC